MMKNKKKAACPDGQAAFENSSAADLQRRKFQVFILRHFGAMQSTAQIQMKTAQQEIQRIMTHGNSEAVHSEFLLSLWAMP